MLVHDPILAPRLGRREKPQDDHLPGDVGHVPTALSRVPRLVRHQRLRPRQEGRQGAVLGGHVPGGALQEGRVGRREDGVASNKSV